MKNSKWVSKVRESANGCFCKIHIVFSLLYCLVKENALMVCNLKCHRNEERSSPVKSFIMNTLTSGVTLVG